MTASDGGPLGYQLGRVVAAIRAQTSEALTPLDLTFPQYVCMRVLDAHPGRSNAELARLAGVSAQSMHAVIQPLEEAGLIERSLHADFGRARPAQLTARGATLLTRAEQAVHIAEETFLACLRPRLQTDFKRALATLAAPDVNPT